MDYNEENFHGHPDFLKLTLDELELHSAKNRDYSKGGDPLGNFKRVAVILSNYPGLKLDQPEVIALVYALKQLDASFWQLSQSYEGEIENIDGRLTDCHVYFKLARILHHESGKAPEESSLL